jgi:Xaa-Pro aminopeptidase
MKTDIDVLMKENDITALLVVGKGKYNPFMVYMTGGVDLLSAILIKKIGEKPVLFHSPIERGEAAASGLPLKSFTEYPWLELMSEAGGISEVASALRLKRMFVDLGITKGNVALYGDMDLGDGYSLLSEFKKLLPEINFVVSKKEDVLIKARITKDETEVERIRKVGKATISVVQRVEDYLSSCNVNNNHLVHADGNPVQIRDIKKMIRLWLLERQVDDMGASIFAIGADAGIPHNQGNPDDFLRLGQTIVFDITPQEVGGGYIFDFTRTWCLGHAPDEVQETYQLVHKVQTGILKKLKSNTPYVDYQFYACDEFEARGHASIRSDPKTSSGYNHTMGHGVGLKVHEAPLCSTSLAETDILKPGMVFTVEPGLYYPEKGFGVRIEDTVWMKPDGSVEILVEYPKELVLKIRG